MPISRSALEQHSQPNVILAESYEFLNDVIDRFLGSGLSEKESFLVVPTGGGNYRAERFDRITAALARHGEAELYKQVGKLAWLPVVAKVTGSDGRMDDDDVARWARRLDGRALVIEEDHTFAGLIYTPATMRGSIGKTLMQIYQSFMSRESALPPELEIAPPPKGLFDSPPAWERESSAIGESAEAPASESNGESQGAGSGSGGLEGLPATGGGAASSLQSPFHTDIRFANWLKPGQTRPLTVQLTKERPTASMSDEQVIVPFEEEFTAETIHVHLDAPGFSERANIWQKPIEVYSFQDSDKATFILTAGQEEGERQISIDFRHKERLIGNSRFVVTVSAAQPAVAGPVAADALTFRQPPPALEISAAPPPPPDVELRIRADGPRLSFELHSPHQEVDASYAPMGGVELTSEPQAYMQARYDELSQWAKGRPANADVVAEISDRLIAIGNGLFLTLFPDQLKRAYWKLVRLRKAGKIASLHIISDEPWIPWEMVKPVDLEAEEADDFLAHGWQVSRWLAGPGQVDKLKIGAARLVAPDTDLAFVKRERDFFAGLSGSAVDVVEPLRRLAQVKEAAREGVELLHFSTHGELNSQSIDRSTILLEDNAELRPDDLLGEAVLGLRKKRPLIFMNTCHGARMGFSLAGLGGWASQMIVQAKAGVFIGALWEVDDALAADFSLAFYGQLQVGKTLGVAFHTARMGIRTSAPANSTWLAYTLYGDPNIRVTWGSHT